MAIHKLSFDFMYYYNILVLETCLMWTLVQNNGFSLISSVKKSKVSFLRVTKQAYCQIIGDKRVRIRKEARQVPCVSVVAFRGATGCQL